MNKHMSILVTVGSAMTLVIALLLLVAPTAGEQAQALLEPQHTLQTPDAITAFVVFPHDPNWPPYAQTEITVHPEPPVVGQPAEICVWVMNTENVTQTATVDLGIASFGIGQPFTNVGSRTLIVPPNSRVQTCVAWIPRQEGHWCVQAVLHQVGLPDQTSQHNIDVWENLQPGVRAVTEFPVRNPLTISAPIHLDLKINPAMANWDISLSQTDMQLAPGQNVAVTLAVTPPVGIKLGTGDTIVDVEATALLVPQPQLIGGFRKLDWPPVPLHLQRDPPYAEGEITVEPYPPQAGEPTRICVELTNQRDTPRIVDVAFEVSGQLGIGLPFEPIDHQLVEIPAHSTIRVCTMWVPPKAGQFCVQIVLRDPQGIYVDQRSQRNMDVNEILFPGQPQPAVLVFPVRNPNPFQVTVNLTATNVSSFFDVWLQTVQLPDMQPGETRPVTLTVMPKVGSVPEDGAIIADVEASYTNAQQQRVLIGGIRKIYRPPIPIHRPGDPPYAEREISIQPYPPRAGEPTEICVELRNPTNLPQTIWVEFAWANFGIGLPWHPFHGQMVTLPAHSIVNKCTVWVPPFAGHFCAQVTLRDPEQHFPEVKSQRNMDVGEVFGPDQWTEPFVFLVGNPGDQPTDIELVPIVHLPGWQAVLDPSMLMNVAPQVDLRPVTLTVRPPAGVPLPEDDTPVVDVEAYAAGRLIGGFRKIYRPPVPIHRPQDPVYAESEISINPYPPREREPTEICVDVRNPTDVSQTISVTFAVANFGIGLPFHDIARPMPVTVPPNGAKRTCVVWVPPFGGQFCARVTLQMSNHEPVWSQRNMDVSEILVPGRPSTLTFPVGNPTTETVTVTLGTVLHLEKWDVRLAQDELTNMLPDERRLVTLVVTPPLSLPMPPDGAPVVDVEGYIGRELVGGFRKEYHPPVPIHQPRDPVYAESEIRVDPYPTWAGVPTLLEAIVYNPTPATQRITVTFSVAHFGIGMPFTTTGILTPTMVVIVPPMGAARVNTIWIAHYRGLFCAQIELQSAGHDPVWSQRNIDVGEPLRPDRAHERIVEVRNPLTQTATINMALINHRPAWEATITPTVLSDVPPGVVRQVLLTVKPSDWSGLTDGDPVVDVEAYINGELIGGIRKIARPPIPLHRPQDQPYAESEISVTPYPLQAGQPATITTEIINTSEETQTIRVLFGVANFGFGIPFTTTGIATPSMMVTLGPGISQTVSTTWTPPSGGHWCIQIRLQDPNNPEAEQRSQRNVEVERRVFRPCEPFTKEFLLQNPLQMTITVTLGASAINLPPGWTYSTNITETTLGPGQSVTVTVTITPPCSLGLSPASLEAMLYTGGASGPTEINIEGYTNGQMIVDGAGIQIQFDPIVERKTYLPLVLKRR